MLPSLENRKLLQKISAADNVTITRLNDADNKMVPQPSTANYKARRRAVKYKSSINNLMQSRVYSIYYKGRKVRAQVVYDGKFFYL